MKEINVINKAAKLTCKENLDSKLSNYGSSYYNYLFEEVNNFNCKKIEVYMNYQDSELCYAYWRSENFNTIFKNSAVKNYDYKGELFPLLREDDNNSLKLLDSKFIKSKVREICANQIEDFTDDEINVFATYFQNKAVEKDSRLKYKKALDNKLAECKEVSESIDYYDILKGICLKLTFTDQELSLERLETCNKAYKQEGYFDNEYFTRIENIIDARFQTDDAAKKVFEQTFPQHTDEL